MKQTKDQTIHQTKTDKAENPENIEPLFERDDPFDLFEDWLSKARKAELNDANAMAVATVDKDGLPDVRMVLLKGFDERGFTFYTNANSFKGQHLLHVPKAAACFHWKSLRRQVRIRGPVETVMGEAADRYFASRRRESQIGAWASAQSSVLESRAHLEKKVRDINTHYEGEDVPRPQHWYGWRIRPMSIEFWRDRAFRLHDRLVFTRETDTQSWAKTRLYP